MKKYKRNKGEKSKKEGKKENPWCRYALHHSQFRICEARALDYKGAEERTDYHRDHDLEYHPDTLYLSFLSLWSVVTDKGRED